MTSDMGPSRTNVQHWLVKRVATYLAVPPDQVDVRVPLADLGLDSVYALALTGEVEDTFGVETDSAMVWDYPTIEALGGGIAALLRKSSS